MTRFLRWRRSRRNFRRLVRGRYRAGWNVSPVKRAEFEEQARDEAAAWRPRVRADHAAAAVLGMLIGYGAAFTGACVLTVTCPVVLAGGWPLLLRASVVLATLTGAVLALCYVAYHDVKDMPRGLPQWHAGTERQR